MTGRRTESRHTEHSSSEPLANTDRSFSIRRSRSSAGVAAAATDKICYTLTCKNDERGNLSQACIGARVRATIEDTNIKPSFILGNLVFHNDRGVYILGLHVTYYTCWAGITHIHLIFSSYRAIEKKNV